MVAAEGKLAKMVNFQRMRDEIDGIGTQVLRKNEEQLLHKKVRLGNDMTYIFFY